MKILSVDTASKVCSVCLLEDSNIINELHLDNGKTHSENLVPLLKELMVSSNIQFKDINLISIDNGPGSFTGIRIGLSTIKAIAEVHNIKIVCVSSLKSLSFNVGSNNKNVISLIDARNNQVYCGVFKNNIEKYYALDIREALDIIKNDVDKNTIFVGDGSILHKELIKDFFKMDLNFSDKNEQSSISTGLAGLELYKLGKYDTADTILPFYLRKSQAERMKEINNNGDNK